MLTMQELSPQEAFELLQKGEYVYVDVRSTAEFDGGHPIGAVNIPIMHFKPGIGMYPNDDFASVVQCNIAKDAKIIVGCKTGIRSARACELMTQLGYENVSNMR